LGGKAVPSVPAEEAVAWGVLALGAAAGLAREAWRPAVTPALAALYLDRRLGTGERIVTVCTRPRDPLRPLVARGIEVPRTLPRPPLPREATLLPAALFLLFAAGLLPEARASAGEAGPGAAAPDRPAGAGSAAPSVLPLAELAGAVEGLREGAPPVERTPALRRAIEAVVPRPEDRRMLHGLLDRAERGDSGAARRVGEALGRALGAGRRETEPAPAAAAPGAGAGGRGGAFGPTLYPGSQDLVRAYHAALTREVQRR
ncbi:MAG: hypothetical protein ACE5JG_11720, partial [Planctomycetota bacterium]